MNKSGVIAKKNQCKQKLDRIKVLNLKSRTTDPPFIGNSYAFS